MTATFRHSWKRNIRPFLLQMKNLIINSTHLKRRDTISIPLPKMIHRVCSGLVFAALQRNKAPGKIWNNLCLQHNNITPAKKWSCVEIAKQIPRNRPPDHSSSLWFPPLWYSHWYLWPSPSWKFPPRSLSNGSTGPKALSSLVLIYIYWTHKWYISVLPKIEQLKFSSAPPFCPVPFNHSLTWFKLGRTNATHLRRMLWGPHTMW